METKHTDIRPEPAEDTKTVEEKKDREFLNKKEDCYAIYQIDGSGERVFYHFMGMDYVTESGSMIRRQDYRMVYSDVLLQEDTLDSLYEKFNLHHPEDYTGYSLSVSDIIVIRKGELTEAYYVDSIGFERLNGHPQTEGWYFSGQTRTLKDAMELETLAREEELAFKTSFGYFSIQVAEEGYDYSFYDLSFHEIDGGIYKDPEVSITEASSALLSEEGVSLQDCTRIDHDALEEKAEEAGQEDLKKGQEHFRKEQLGQLINEIETYLEMTDAINQYIRGFLNELGIDMDDLKEKKAVPKPEMKGKEQKPDKGFKM